MYEHIIMIIFIVIFLLYYFIILFLMNFLSICNIFTSNTWGDILYNV